MFLHHIAIWSTDIERLRLFYETYFQVKSGERYSNTAKQFTSYMLAFKDESCRIELMQIPGLQRDTSGKPLGGYSHIAISVGSKNNVIALTEKLKTDGYRVISEPRTTGDRYYESVVLDPDGNYLEINE